jgi:hypothetical protein
MEEAMENAQQVLVYSFVVFLLVLVVAILKITLFAYDAILGGQKFVYRFDKTRLPLSAAMTMLIAASSLLYGFIIARDAGLALQFCLGVTTFGTIGCTLNICYVSKPKKS